MKIRVSSDIRKDDKYGLYIRKINFMECEI